VILEKHPELAELSAEEKLELIRELYSAMEAKGDLEEGAEHLRREAALGSRADFERVLAMVPKVAPEPHDALE
jgi:hypothetical protein